jgi:hypothetical protein
MRFGLFGINLERRTKKVFTRLEKKMGFGLCGMKMQGRRWKELTRLGNLFLKSVGIKVEMKKSVGSL